MPAEEFKTSLLAPTAAHRIVCEMRQKTGDQGVLNDRANHLGAIGFGAMESGRDVQPIFLLI